MHDLRCILSVHIAKVFLGEFMKQTTITSFYCKSHCPLAEFIIHDCFCSYASRKEVYDRNVL